MIFDSFQGKLAVYVTVCINYVFKLMFLRCIEYRVSSPVLTSSPIKPEAFSKKKSNVYDVAQQYDQKCRRKTRLRALSLQQLQSESEIDFVAIEI